MIVRYTGGFLELNGTSYSQYQYRYTISSSARLAYSTLEMPLGSRLKVTKSMT